MRVFNIQLSGPIKNSRHIKLNKDGEVVSEVVNKPAHIVLISRFTGECYFFYIGRRMTQFGRSITAEFVEAMKHRRDCIRWMKDEARNTNS